MGAVCQSHAQIGPLCDDFSQGHGVLTNQTYLIAISLLQYAEFPCCLLALEILISLQQLIGLLQAALW